jgi:hypothetical protein
MRSRRIPGDDWQGSFPDEDFVPFAASVCLLKQDAVRVLLSAEQKHQAGAWVPSR